MIVLCFLLCLCLDLICSSPHFYDHTLCDSGVNYPGTRYTCNSSRISCQTFVVYRANDKFATILSISNLFRRDPSVVLSINSVSSSNQVLETGREVLVPVVCSCTGKYFQINVNYTVSEKMTLPAVSCETFEGLVKYVTLIEENPDIKGVLVGLVLRVPLKCACPESDDDDAGVKFLVTYPFIKGDDTTKLSKKFNVSVEEIWQENHLEASPTVYPYTTVLVPLKEKPVINLSIPDSDPPIPQFLPTVPVERTTKSSQINNLYSVGAVLVFCLILATLVACGLYIRNLKKFKNSNFHSSNHRISSLNSCSTPTRSSANSCLSPDLLIGIKYSLCTFTMEQIRTATKNLSESTKIIDSVYRGSSENGEVMIKEMRFEGTKQVIDLHSKINHVNIVKLHGVCFGEHDFTWSYLVFEYPLNGSLRDCLETSSAAFNWQRRTHVAFDIATGLHYLHYSVIPAYTHLNINSKCIFLTSNWRAKITVFGNAKESRSSTYSKSWIAPEYLTNGLLSEKVDIFAFGVVLFELISGKDAMDGNVFKESISFLGRGWIEGGCFDQLRGLVDPCLKDDYSLAEALCLAILARSCVEDDPMHRPSMDDILKILARMV
ncbi:lysM domain receptor-like kinase 4 [Dorcoceras hygrometricum]|uniref:LysM domain receptor-like kinase 4 n=1 Tax=Dorcoceras hygrometricum TaxID=472368 RepID=A0A2Z7CQW9_9LAMI|nr:lysM domain receptor-like kinase 4 [Dorcoceras hygrometricum]